MKWLYLLCITVLLTGCSVSIDPAQESQDEEKLETASQSNKQKERSEAQSEAEDANEAEPSEGESFASFIDYLFSFGDKDVHVQQLDYLALGDSLTRGVGDENDNYGFTGRLATKLEKWPAISNVALDNRGKNGRRSDQLLNLLKSGHYDEQLPEADLITITLGGNDVMKIVKSDMFDLQPELFEQALTPFEKRYRDIMKEIRTRNADAPIILVGFYNPFSIIVNETTTFKTIIASWNGTIEQIAKDDSNACFVPVDDLFESNKDLIYHTDFFHPNANGYDRMAARVAEQMKQCNIDKMSDGLIGFEE